jgi:hypothetical protein
MNGLNGYLANITSQAEQIFLKDKLTEPGWIGGSDNTTEGIWQWNDGPEAGQVFYVQTPNSSYPVESTRRTTNLIDGRQMYNYFSNGEPNGAYRSEQFAEFAFGVDYGDGKAWNDCQNSCPDRKYYVIEYGDDGGTTTAATTSFNVLIPVAPTITSTAAPTSNSAGGAILPGSVLTAAFTYAGAPTPTKTFTWQSTASISGTPTWETISGATSDTYTIPVSSVGKFFRAVVTASNVGGTTSATPSSATAVTGLATLVAPDLNVSSDTGSSGTDNSTADNTPTLDFSGVTEGATVTATASKVSSSNVTCTTSAAGAGGTASCTLGTLSDGTWSITATQNLNSQTSSISPALSVAIDTVKPSITASSLTRDLSVATQVNISLTFSESVTLNDTAGLEVSSGWTATTPEFSGTGVTFSATKSGSVSHKLVVTLAGGFAKDLRGNTSNSGTATIEDNVAPTLTLTSTSGSTSSSRDLQFVLSGNEPLSCPTLTSADFDLTKLRIDSVTAHPSDSGKCLINAVSMVSPGGPDNSTIAAKSSGFSVSDSESVAQTSIGTGSNLTVEVTIVDAASGGINLTPISGTVPTQLPFARPSRVMGNISPALQEALIAQGIVAAPAGSPGIKVESDLSHISSDDSITVTETHTINTGERVELRIRVSPSMQSTHDTVAYMKKGGTWFYLGRASFDTDWANSDAISLGEPGTYIFKVFLISKSQTVLSANVPTSKFSSSMRVLENFMVLNTSLTDSSVDSTSDQSLRVDLTVNGSAVPVAAPPSATPAPSSTPRPSPSATVVATPTPTPTPTPTETRAAVAAPTPTPSPSFSPATSIPPITPALGVRLAPQPTEPPNPRIELK